MLVRTNIQLSSMGPKTSNEFLIPKVHGCIYPGNKSELHDPVVASHAPVLMELVLYHGHTNQ